MSNIAEAEDKALANRSKMPGISVITVCRNEVGSIERTIQSVLNQSYADIEFIVVDGASTDGTLAVLRKYEYGIESLISEPDHGIYSAMNKGLRKSTKDYVYFLNGGDRFHNDDVLETIIQESAGEEIIYGDMVLSYRNGKKELKRQPRKMTYLRFIATSLWQPACMVKREVFERVGHFDEAFEICADYEFFMKALFKERVSTRYVAIPFSIFDAHGVSREKEKMEIHRRERQMVQRKHFPFHIYVLASIKPYLRSRRDNPAAAAALRFLTRLNTWLKVGHY